MSESKWTAGPWRVVRRNDNPKEVYIRDEGGLIAEGTFPSHWPGQDDRFASEVDQYEANARLIAAAPDLAEALEKLITAVEESCRTVDRQFIQLEIDTARAALSRASAVLWRKRHKPTAWRRSSFSPPDGGLM